MRVRLFLSFIIIIFAIIDNQKHVIAQEQGNFIDENNINNNLQNQSRNIIPFPQCFQSELAPSFIRPHVLEFMFDWKLEEEDKKLIKEQERNIDSNNDGVIDFNEVQLRSDTFNGALVARTATKVADELLYQLACKTNATVSHELNSYLKQISIPSKLCAFDPNADCAGLKYYRTITGVCNNLRLPYQGSSQTAFGRLLPAAYQDGLHKPRSQSVLGGPLPSCRKISLSMGSKPNIDITINNLWVTYGQYLVHDITLSTPVSDAGRIPISSCGCNSNDTDMCTVIDIAADDPFMSRQKCIVTPATAQAFSEQSCTLSAKEQMNGNTHYIDLSATYGSTRLTAANLRTFTDGLMRMTHHSEFKYDLPPGQRQGRSCIDPTESNKCFAGGDSRLMLTSVLTGVQLQWLRMHNNFAKELADIRPDWESDDNILFEESRKILSALHQHYTYTEWLPILIGQKKTQKFIGGESLFSEYDPAMPGVVFNEVATAVLRLHTFVRDLISRRAPNGDLIDELWFNDISLKSKYAYDTETNGLDSFLCGAIYDSSFGGDLNFAQQIHHQLFESTNHQGETRRSDLVSLNICRGREHGIPSYNAYRKFCGFKYAEDFEDFEDTMSSEEIEKLKMLYKHPDDVDLFVGVHHEQHLSDAVVGPTSACIIINQFQHLKYGDRLFYTHYAQFTTDQLYSIRNYSYHCFICHSTDIKKVPRNPFRPPDKSNNPLKSCRKCANFDLSPWKDFN